MWGRSRDADAGNRCVETVVVGRMNWEIGMDGCALSYSAGSSAHCSVTSGLGIQEGGPRRRGGMHTQS